MNVVESIEQDRSNENMWHVANYLLENRKEISLLFPMMENGNTTQKLRFSWCFTKLVEIDKEIILPYYSQVINLLNSTNNGSLRRNLCRSIFHSTIPKKDYAVLFDLCTGFLLEPKEPVAVRMFSMRILYKITRKVPELTNEFKQILEAIEPTVSSSGLRNSYTKLLKKYH